MAWMGVWWFVGAVIAALFWAIFASSARGPGSRSDSPERILKRRYAKGEIDHDTYERMRSELRG
jgi:putative membrane protein